MPDPRIPLPQPIKGLRVDQPFSDQPPNTTRDAMNVRGVDPDTGRTRISQRSGLTKYNSNVVASGQKIDDLAYVVYDNKRVTYAELGSGSETEEWANITPSGEQCRNIATDRQSNVYALNGTAGIVKYNSEGTERFKIALPAEDDGHIVRALYVDDLDCIYAGVSEGGNQRTSRAWKYQQGPDEDQFFQVWEIEPGGYIEDILIADDQAYLAVNFDDEARAEVQVYDTIDNPRPRLISKWETPHPISGLDVNSSGNAFTSHPLNPDETAERPGNPKAIIFGPTIVDWTPRDLTDWESRIYRWHDAQEITDKSKGDQILQWDDISGNDRHLIANFGTALPPTYEPGGIAGRPTVRFEVTDYSTTNIASDQQGLETLKNPGTALNNRDQQQTFVPSHTGTAFTLYMVVRCTVDAANIHTLWYQADSVNVLRGIFINREEAGGTGVQTSGEVSVYEPTTGPPASPSPPGGTGGHPNSFAFTGDDTDTILITYQHDGGLNSGVGGRTDSVLRVNGNPVDQWESIGILSDGPSYIGTDGSPGSGGADTAWKGFTGNIAEIIVLNRSDYTSVAEPTVQTEDLGIFDAVTPDQTDNEMTRIEGYLMNKWGIAQQAPDTTDPNPHPYGPDSDNFVGPPTGGSTGNPGLSLQGSAQTIKWSPAGNIVWLRAATSATGSVGLDVKLGKADDSIVYTVGDVVGSGVSINKFIDQGDSVSALAADGAWVATAGTSSPQNQRIKMDVDHLDNLYVPMSDSTQSTTLRVYDVTGTTAGAGVLVGNVDLATNERGNAVAVDPDVPDFGSDSVDIAEFCYIASEATDNTDETVTKIRFVSVTGTTGSHRTAQLLAVANGSIYKVSDTGSPSNPTGGSSALSSNSNYIESVALRGVVYYVDGEQYKKYVGKDDEVTVWESTSSGKIPPRCRLINAWRGRIVLAGDPDNQSLWHMSATGDAENWDQFPPVPLATQAISANNNNQTAGLVPDIVTTMIPYDDDVLIFGCDHSIWRLTGDPMAGGELDLVSDITGMGFGRPWAKDPDGVIYFVGSRGGLYRMAPGGKPQRISQSTIERKLQDNFDFSTHYIRMAYNWRDEGLHIFQFPYGTATQVKHYWWDSKHDAAWEDEVSLTTAGAVDLQPTSVIVLDGDQVADRVLLLGHADSFVRKWDEDAFDDDGVRIYSKVLIGPIAGSRSADEMKFSHGEIVLAEDQGGATYRLFASHDPDDTGVAIHTDELSAGRNPYISSRMRGAFCWLSLENGEVSNRWSLESASIRAVSGGRKRVRSG